MMCGGGAMKFRTTVNAEKYDTIGAAVKALQDAGLVQVTIYDEWGMPVAHYGLDKRVTYLTASDRDPVEWLFPSAKYLKRSSFRYTAYSLVFVVVALAVLYIFIFGLFRVICGPCGSDRCGGYDPSSQYDNP